MRVFVAGATGVIGRPLVSRLVREGFQVTGTTRTPGKLEELRTMGAEPALMDARHRDDVLRAVLEARPDVVVHQMTAIPPVMDVRRFAESLAMTNRLRTEGTQFLMDAARAAGARRFIAQSYSGWPNSREGGRVKFESDPLDQNPPKAMGPTLEAIRKLESMVAGASEVEGLVLRYGAFYGPGSSISSDGSLVSALRKRLFPIFGPGTGVWSFIHVEDAVEATVRAIEDGPTGIYNIVDDDPAEVAQWLPELAKAVGAPKPLRLPGWLGTLLMGEAGMSLMNEVRGSSNLKARKLLGWEPRFTSWRVGFHRGLDRFLAPRQRERATVANQSKQRCSG
jgi:2-alkyl-3-oxoalkanoate reductase